MRETALGAYAHQDLPFERLVEELQPERDLAPHAAVPGDVRPAERAAARRCELPGLALRAAARSTTGTAKFDLTLVLRRERRAGSPAASSTTPTCSTRATVERLRGPLRTPAGAAAAADPGAPRLPSCRCSPRPSAQQLARRVERHARPPCPREPLLHELFEAQAARTPGAPWPWSSAAERLTYGELDAPGQPPGPPPARAWASGRRCRSGSASSARRSWSSALLGVLKAGGAYVPLDPGLPARSGWRFMLEDARRRVLVDRSARLPAGCRRHGARVVLLDDDAEDGRRAGGAAGAGARPGAASPTCIYTSGSTGRPKGVAVAAPRRRRAWLRWTPATSGSAAATASLQRLDARPSTSRSARSSAPLLDGGRAGGRCRASAGARPATLRAS